MQGDHAEFEARGEPAATLVARIIALYRANAADQSAGAAILSHGVENLDGLAPPRPQAVGRSLPVRRSLARALSSACGGSLADVAEAFALAEPALAWLQNPNYSAQRMGPDFVDGYGYVELVGPEGTFESRKLRVGFLLLGPYTLYPDHSTRLRKSITLYPAERTGTVEMARGRMNHPAPLSIMHRMRRMPCAPRTSRCSRCTAGWATLQPRPIC